MSEFHLIMGLPLSGKTTYAEEHIVPNDTPLVMMTEAYMNDVSGQPRMTRESWDEFYRDLGKSLAKDDIVVIDGNNTHRGSRKRMLEFARSSGARTHLHVLCTPPVTCTKRARKTGEALDGNLLRSQINKFFVSLGSIAEEPWDEVTWVPGEYSDED